MGGAEAGGLFTNDQDAIGEDRRRPRYRVRRSCVLRDVARPKELAGPGADLREAATPIGKLTSPSATIGVAETEPSVLNVDAGFSAATFSAPIRVFVCLRNQQLLHQ